MSKFVVAIFPDEVKASDEARRLKELASKDSGSVLKSLAVVGRTPDGKLHVKESIVEGASGAAAGALIGALAGLPAGGPAAAALARRQERCSGFPLICSIVTLVLRSSRMSHASYFPAKLQSLPKFRKTGSAIFKDKWRRLAEQSFGAASHLWIPRPHIP